VSRQGHMSDWLRPALRTCTMAQFGCPRGWRSLQPLGEPHGAVPQPAPGRLGHCDGLHVQTPRAALAPTPRLHASGMVSTQSAEIARNAGRAANRPFPGLSADHIAMCAQTHLNAPGAPCRKALRRQFGAAFAPGAPAEPRSGASRSVRRCRKARRCVGLMPIGSVRAIKLRIAKRFLFPLYI